MRRRRRLSYYVCLAIMRLVTCCALLFVGEACLAAAGAPFHQAELIFPLEKWHNHSSCIVETPSGDLLVT